MGGRRARGHRRPRACRCATTGGADGCATSGPVPLRHCGALPPPAGPAGARRFGCSHQLHRAAARRARRAAACARVHQGRGGTREGMGIGAAGGRLRCCAARCCEATRRGTVHNRLWPLRRSWRPGVPWAATERLARRSQALWRSVAQRRLARCWRASHPWAWRVSAGRARASQLAAASRDWPGRWHGRSCCARAAGTGGVPGPPPLPLPWLLFLDPGLREPTDCPKSAEPAALQWHTCH